MADGNSLPTSTPPVDFSKKIDPSSIKDQGVLVTGGASGIGEAFAEALAGAGAYVTMLDLQDEKGKAVARRLTEKGYKAQFVQGDVRSWDDQVKAFEAALSFSPFKSLDIVLVVAGVSGQNVLGWLDTVTAPDAKLVPPDTKCVDVNLKAAMHTTYLSLYYLRKSLKTESRSTASKQVVFVSSLAGYVGIPLSTDYAASKWGLRGVWRTLRDEKGLLGDHATTKFRTSLIAPWFVRTGMTQPFVHLFRENNLEVAEPSDVVDALMRVVCDEEVVSRAICVLPEGKSFDLCDDFEGFDAGREWPQRMQQGLFGPASYTSMTDFFSSLRHERPKI